jgi:hypothetical protein
MSIERLWDFFIKVLHTLYASRLNFPNKIKDLQFVHIIELIQIDLVTFIKYIMIIEHFVSANLSQNIIIFIYIYIYIYIYI